MEATSDSRTTVTMTSCSSRKLPFVPCKNKFQLPEVKMDEKFTRRSFLQSAGAAACVGAGLALPGQAQAAARGDDATGVAGKARLFPGCCAYSYRKYLASGQMSMQDF